MTLTIYYKHHDHEPYKVRVHKDLDWDYIMFLLERCETLYSRGVYADYMCYVKEERR